MTKDSFIRRVNDILWSYSEDHRDIVSNKGLRSDDCKVLILEAFDEHVAGMTQEQAEENNADYVEMLREKEREEKANRGRD